MHVLDNNIGNCRYPGHSEFHSAHSLQNSSYCYTIPNSIRIKDRDYKPLNDNFYNLPMLKSTRATEQGRGPKSYIGLKFGKGSPSPADYYINSIFEDNLKYNKGFTVLGKSVDLTRNKKYIPGVGSYNLRKDGNFGSIPISIKFRNGFFYDDDLRKKKYTVSMQRYHPLYSLVESNRYEGVGIGYGNKVDNFNKNAYPGPGTYKIPSIFDRGLKGKLALN